MLADYFTKSLQGVWFRFSRDIVMGKVSIQAVVIDNTKMKEHVGEYENSFFYGTIKDWQNKKDHSAPKKAHCVQKEKSWAE